VLDHAGSIPSEFGALHERLTAAQPVIGEGLDQGARGLRPPGGLSMTGKRGRGFA
jgi:hypothetical protein